MDPKTLAPAALKRCRFCQVGIDEDKRFCGYCAQDERTDFKAGNQTVKALSLAAVLRAHGFKAAQVASFTDETWAMAETLGGLRGSSKTTRTIAVVLLASQEV